MPKEKPERSPLRTRFFYGIGSVAEGTKNTAFNVFLLFYYNVVLGLPGTLSGAAIFIALCVDAITDPLVGAISDDTRTRFGRRHPYMYAAALPMALCFFALFRPPAGLTETGLFLWLTCFAVGVRVSMTFYAIPSGAMVAELTDDYDERTSLVSWRVMFGWLGGISVSLLGYVVFLAPNDSFPDGRLDPGAYLNLGIAGAVMVFTAILICTAGTHHLIPKLKSPPPPEPFTLARLRDEFRPVFQNHSYVMLVVASIFASVAGGFNDVVGLYVNTYFWEFTTGQIAMLVWALLPAIAIAFMATRPLTERFEKKRAALGLASFAILFGPFLIFLRLFGVLPENGDPRLLWMVIGHAVILVALVISISIIIASMVADIVDENELATGRRQEGVFASAIAFAAKATSGVGGLMAGIALDLIAFPRGTASGDVDPDKVTALGLVVGPGMMMLFLVTLVFLSRYRITRANHVTTLAALAARNAALPRSSPLRERI